MKTVFLFICILFSANLSAQVILDPERDHFIYHVHTIDDFIERFNGVPSPKAEEAFFKIQKPEDNTKRRAWVLSLFDQGNAGWDFPEIEGFLSTINNSSSPRFLSFEEGGWYAVVETTFFYGYRPKKLWLVLEIDYEASTESSRWVICLVMPNNFFEEICTDSFPQATSNHILNPMSHATNFIGLNRALEDKENLNNCFKSLQDSLVLTFAWEVYHDNLKLKSIDKVDFFFFQIPGWLFKVSQYEREGMNAGWLISSLEKVSTKQHLALIQEALDMETPGK